MFYFVQNWVNSIELHSIFQAKLVCWIIPSNCPFARNVQLGKFNLSVPPLCKINPLYEQLSNLRVRALVYLEHESH